MKKTKGLTKKVSRLFIYFNARCKDQQTKKVIDTGCKMESALEALQLHGSCREPTWPYELGRVNMAPDYRAYQEAKNYKIVAPAWVQINLQEMKSCLAQGFPFIFGIKLFTTFDQAKSTGVVPTPTWMDQPRQAHGRHAMLAVGYDDLSRVFIVRNSWGERWVRRLHREET